MSAPLMSKSAAMTFKLLLQVETSAVDPLGLAKNG